MGGMMPTGVHYLGMAQYGMVPLVQQIIDDDPTLVYRTRDTLVDKFRGTKAKEVTGPYKVRIEKFRHSRIFTTFDEKGSMSQAGFVIVALDIPRGEWEPEDLLTVDGTADVYRITSITYDGRIVEVNLEYIQ